MTITVLGPLTVNGSGLLSRRDRVVLETLATRPGHPVRADQLADALWQDDPPASATKNLQGCIVRLRKALGEDAITTTAHGYVLTVPPDEIDSERFERMVVRGRELLALGEADRAAYLLTEALALWQGEPFADLEGWAPSAAPVRRLAELRLEAEELRVDAHLRAGRYAEVLAAAQAMVREAPLRERRWTLLALAQYQAGNQAEALRVLHQLKSVLLQQLGIDPGPDVAALEEAILRQDSSLVTLATESSRSACPYLGLKAYDVGDADLYFGRDQDVDACLAILQRRSLLALVGPSGSGKSSLLRAGVAASLAARGQVAVTITPGAHPMAALAGLAKEPPTNALLVDQFEEVFTLCEDEEDRESFLSALVTEASRRPVALAIRADRLAGVTAHGGLSRLVEQGLHLVGAMDAAGLREAIESPARLAGLMIEPGLVDLLLREVQDDSGALPLLSHALLETWKRREGNTLTVAGYRASGGIHGAVAQSAERLYAEVGVARRQLVRDLMLRLVSPGQQGEALRVKVPRRMIGTDSEHEQLIEKLVSARLVTSDEGVLEITHEALARAWPRLRGWLDDDVEGQRLLHHLSSAADAWDGLERPESELYRGIRLERALEWRDRTAGSITPVERDFLDAAEQSLAAEERDLAQRNRAQGMLIRRLRLVLAGATALLLLALVAGVLAVVQRRDADRHAAAAAASETAALARRASAAALATEDVEESLLLALSGLALDPTPHTRTNLLAALGRNARLIRSTPLHDDEPDLFLDASPDGRLVATLDYTHMVRVYDAATGTFLNERRVGSGRIAHGIPPNRLLAFSPDSRLLAVAGTPLEGPVFELLDADTLLPAPGLGAVPADAWSVNDLSFSADGTHFVGVLDRHDIARLADAEERPDGRVAVTETHAMVWDLAAPATPVDLRLPVDGGISVALDAQGRSLFSTAPLTRHDLRTGTATVLGEEQNPLDYLTPIAGGAALVGIKRGHLAVVLDAGSGQEVAVLENPGPTRAIRVSPNGRTLILIGWNDRVITEWPATRNPEDSRQTFSLDRGNPGSVAYTADGAGLLAIGSDGDALRRWDLRGEDQFVARVPTSGPGGWFGVVAPGGQRSAMITSEGWTFHDYATGQTTSVPMGDGYRHTVGAWHPDGRHYATAVGSEVRVWDIDDATTTGLAQVESARVTEIGFSPDGSRLAVSEMSGRVRMLDGRTLTPVGRPVEVGEPVAWVATAPDDRTAVVLTGGPGESMFWVQPTTGWALVDLESGRVVRRGRLHMASGRWLDLSPDGRFAVVGGGSNPDEGLITGADGAVEVIDLRTGESHRTAATTATVQLVAYSPDGQRLLTTGHDGAVTLWDADGLIPLQAIRTEDSATVMAEFLPNGRDARLLDFSSGVAVTWNHDEQSAVDFACQAVGRDMTADEWHTWFGDRPQPRLCPATLASG